jgi:hypothetical protein
MTGFRFCKKDVVKLQNQLAAPAQGAHRVFGVEAPSISFFEPTNQAFGAGPEIKNIGNHPPEALTKDAKPISRLTMGFLYHIIISIVIFN